MYWTKNKEGGWWLHVGKRNAESIQMHGDGYAVCLIQYTESGWQLCESMNMWAGWFPVAFYKTLADAKRAARKKV